MRPRIRDLLPALLVPALAAGAPAAAPSAPAPDDPRGLLRSLEGGSWVGEGAWTDGKPFFARHVFESSLGGRLLGITTWGRRADGEAILFETRLDLGGTGPVPFTCVASFGATYAGTATRDGDALVLDSVDDAGARFSQRFEPSGEDACHWTSLALTDAGRDVLATIDFARSPLVPRAGSRDVHAEIVVDAAPDAVFDAWTTDAGLATFFSPRPHVDARPGGEFDVFHQPELPVEQRGTVDTRILALDRGSLLSFTWNSPSGFETHLEHTVVSLRFTALDDGRTRVRLDDVGFGDDPRWDRAVAYFREAWPYVLGNLRRRFAEGPIDWTHPPAPPASMLALKR
ncbi:MAG: SRPBCC domain-containing protein [Planctomycetes bacterium]|nr:SRPBCC domain-containing protein [Planctomycetota bacterium]